MHQSSVHCKYFSLVTSLSLDTVEHYTITHSTVSSCQTVRNTRLVKCLGKQQEITFPLLKPFLGSVKNKSRQLEGRVKIKLACIASCSSSKNHASPSSLLHYLAKSLSFHFCWVNQGAHYKALRQL